MEETLGRMVWGPTKAPRGCKPIQVVWEKIGNIHFLKSLLENMFTDFREKGREIEIERERCKRGT